MVRLVRKVEVFRKPQGRAAVQRAPVVGSRGLYLGAFDQIAEVDFQRWSVTWRIPAAGLEPSSMLSPGLLLLSGDEEVAVLETDTQKVAWRRASGGHAPWKGSLLMSAEDSLQVVNASLGDIARTIPVQGIRPGRIIPLESVIVLTQQRGSQALSLGLEPGSGRVLWKQDLIKQLERAGCPTQGVRYVTGGGSESFIVGGPGFIAVFSARTGEALWHASIDVPYFRPLLDQGRVAVLSDQRFVALDEQTGRVLCDRAYPELWKMIRIRPGVPMPGGVAAYVSEAGEAAAFDIQSGDKLWHERHAVMFQGLAVAGKTLLASGSDGWLWAFEA